MKLPLLLLVLCLTCLGSPGLMYLVHPAPLVGLVLAFLRLCLMARRHQTPGRLQRARNADRLFPAEPLHLPSTPHSRLAALEPMYCWRLGRCTFASADLTLYAQSGVTLRGQWRTIDKVDPDRHFCYPVWDRLEQWELLLDHGLFCGNNLAHYECLYGRAGEWRTTPTQTMRYRL